MEIASEIANHPKTTILPKSKAECEEELKERINCSLAKIEQNQLSDILNLSSELLETEPIPLKNTPQSQLNALLSILAGQKIQRIKEKRAKLESLKRNTSKG